MVSWVTVRQSNVSCLQRKLEDEYAGPRLYTLSPFLVIDNAIEMNKLDVDQVLNAGIGSGAGQSRLKPILAELRSTNPAIASLAQTMAYNNATMVRTNE